MINLIFKVKSKIKIDINKLKIYKQNKIKDMKKLDNKKYNKNNK